MPVHRIEWDCGRAEIETMAGMLGPIEFFLGDGRKAQPMAVAPWADDEGPEFDALPDLLKRLRGEWPCVPFGAPSAPAGLPADWTGVPVSGLGDDFHGYSSHNQWSKIRDLPNGLELSIEYPETHAVKRLGRRIEGVAGKTRVCVSLSIEVRHDVLLPIALHPVFKLPRQTGAAQLDVGEFSYARTFPVTLEPGISCFAVDKVVDDLSAVPSDKGMTDVTKLPLGYATEELVQVCGAKGQISLRNMAERYVATLEYDPAVFPSVLLWISNNGRKAYPWNGRHLGLGIEPVCGAFDLGPEVAANPDNPFAKSGVSTAVRLRAGQTFSTSYSISVDSL